MQGIRGGREPGGTPSPEAANVQMGMAFDQSVGLREQEDSQCHGQVAKEVREPVQGAGVGAGRGGVYPLEKSRSTLPAARAGLFKGVWSTHFPLYPQGDNS